MLQLLPFQRSIKVKPPPSPTAQESPADTAVTPYRALSSAPALKTWLQLFPFQRSINVLVLKLNEFRDLPTAQMLLAAVPDMARKMSSPRGLGLETTLHVEPSQCSTSVKNPNAALPL